MLESDSLPPPSGSESSSNNAPYTDNELIGSPGRAFWSLLGLVVPGKRGDGTTAGAVFRRGRGVLARIMSISGLAALVGPSDGAGDELCIMSPLPFLESRRECFQGSVCESRRDGSFNLLSDRFLALPNTALASFGL
jgi:hypothetical protein